MAYKNASRPDAARKLPLSEGSWDTIADLYDDGKTDLEIAEAVGCSSKTIARWRWREGYTRNDRATNTAEAPDAS